ncbi:GNAT family N-acetyltransferase [Superficieibacter sp. HKU1]|uniref:GNAT family N-acetyltransferase n=1 Tax=Superficieibacter sp. HKU1 TaxID=3031919 RepID=UPI0023E2B614|nr:GNAT family N-acetyltransferase [Superficieibacter sp. HKU1]WES66511.1 GNAT family N-acetyltransferase [Superficieibacter sp. HKU1]
MQLTSTRLLLRPLTTGDADDLYRIYGDPETNTFNPVGPYPSLHYAQQRLAVWIAEYERYGYGNWAIALRETPARIVGFAGITVRELDGALTHNLGYRFSPETWGKGIASEFCHFAVRYAFTTLDLHELTAVVRPAHLASQRVLEKAGMIKTATVNDVPDAAPSLVYRLTSLKWREYCSRQPGGR